MQKFAGHPSLEFMWSEFDPPKVAVRAFPFIKMEEIVPILSWGRASRGTYVSSVQTRIAGRYQNADGAAAATSRYLRVMALDDLFCFLYRLRRYDLAVHIPVESGTDL